MLVTLLCDGSQAQNDERRSGRGIAAVDDRPERKRGNWLEQIWGLISAFAPRFWELFDLTATRTAFLVGALLRIVAGRTAPYKLAGSIRCKDSCARRFTVPRIATIATSLSGSKKRWVHVLPSISFRARSYRRLHVLLEIVSSDFAGRK